MESKGTDIRILGLSRDVLLETVGVQNPQTYRYISVENIAQMEFTILAVLKEKKLTYADIEKDAGMSIEAAANQMAKDPVFAWQLGNVINSQLAHSRVEKPSILKAFEESKAGGKPVPSAAPAETKDKAPMSQKSLSPAHVLDNFLTLMGVTPEFLHMDLDQFDELVEASDKGNRQAMETLGARARIFMPNPPPEIFRRVFFDICGIPEESRKAYEHYREPYELLSHFLSIMAVNTGLTAGKIGAACDPVLNFTHVSKRFKGDTAINANFLIAFANLVHEGIEKGIKEEWVDEQTKTVLRAEDILRSKLGDSILEGWEPPIAEPVTEKAPMQWDYSALKYAVDNNAARAGISGGALGVMVGHDISWYNQIYTRNIKLSMAELVHLADTMKPYWEGSRSWKKVIEIRNPNWIDLDQEDWEASHASAREYFIHRLKTRIAEIGGENSRTADEISTVLGNLDKVLASQAELGPGLATTLGPAVRIAREHLRLSQDAVAAGNKSRPDIDHSVISTLESNGISVRNVENRNLVAGSLKATLDNMIENIAESAFSQERAQAWTHRTAEGKMQRRNPKKGF